MSIPIALIIGVILYSLIVFVKWKVLMAKQDRDKKRRAKLMETVYKNDKMDQKTRQRASNLFRQRQEAEEAEKIDSSRGKTLADLILLKRKGFRGKWKPFDDDMFQDTVSRIWLDAQEQMAQKETQQEQDGEKLSDKKNL